MHFNEMQVKSRQLGLTFVAAALGIGIVLLSNGNDFAFSVPMGGYEFKLHVTVLLVAGAWLALRAVRQLDLYVYHPMLRGAVTFGMDLEKNRLSKVFDLEKGMTEAISHFSRFEDAKAEPREDGRAIYSGSKKVTAQGKIGRFYSNTSWFLAFAGLVLVIFTNAAPLSDVYMHLKEPSIHLDQTTKPVSDETEPQGSNED